MKQLFRILFVAVIAIFALNTEASAQKKKKEAEVTFSVNVDCPACVKKLESNLPFEKGVKDLRVSLEEQTVWFKYQPKKTDVQALEAAIEKLGYEAEEIKPEQKESEK